MYPFPFFSFSVWRQDDAYVLSLGGPSSAEEQLPVAPKYCPPWRDQLAALSR